MPGIGDIKLSVVGGDHEGWYLLDGRLVSTLPAATQANALTVGITTNLPDQTGSVLGYNGTVGTVTGNNNKTISRNNLPNENLDLSNIRIPSHSHNATTSSAGGHSHALFVNATGSAGFTPLKDTTQNLAVQGVVCETTTTGDIDYAMRFHNGILATKGASSVTPAHVHSVTVPFNPAQIPTGDIESLNGGVAQIDLDATPKTLNVNSFIFLD
jgi:hypothetical protein